MPIRNSTVYETARRGAHGDQTTNSAVNPPIIQRKIQLGMLDNQGHGKHFWGKKSENYFKAPTSFSLREVTLRVDQLASRVSVT